MRLKSPNRFSSLPGRNYGASSRVNTTIDNTVARANSRLEEALNTDGVPFLYWHKSLQGLRCTCQLDATKPPTDGSIIEDAQNNGVAVVDATPHEDPSRPGFFKVRGFDTTPYRYGRAKLSEQETPNPTSITGEEVGTSPTMLVNEYKDKTYDDIADGLLYDDDDDLLLLGDETITCGICFATGFTEGYTLANGKRQCLDASGAYKATLYGGFLDTDAKPFTYNLEAGGYVEWEFELPTYFTRVLNITPRSNLLPNTKVSLEFRFANENAWVYCDIDFLNSRKGIPTKGFIRATAYEATKLTHVELNIQLQDWLKLQMDPLSEGSNPAAFKAAFTTSFDLPPRLVNVAKEGVIYEQKYNMMWKLTDVTDGKTAKQQIFSWKASAREIKPNIEQLYALKIINDPQLPTAQSKLQPYHANATRREDVFSYVSTYGDDRKKAQVSISGVTLTPPNGEYGFEDFAYSVDDVPASLEDNTDWQKLLAKLKANPAIEMVWLEPEWYGNNLNAADCTIKPKTRLGDVDDTNNWNVQVLQRYDVDQVSESLIGTEMVRPLGGTISDGSLIRTIQHLKAAGYKVGLRPKLVMDIPYDSGLPMPFTPPEPETPPDEYYDTGGCLYFGYNAYITYNPHTDWDFGITRFSIGMQFKAANIINGAHLFMIGTDTLRNLGIVLNNGVWTLWVNNVAAISGSAPISNIDSAWHFLSVSRYGDFIYVHVDGVHGGTYEIPGGSVNTGYLCIGNMSQVQTFEASYHGKITNFFLSKGYSVFTFQDSPYDVPTQPMSPFHASLLLNVMSSPASVEDTTGAHTPSGATAFFMSDTPYTGVIPGVPQPSIYTHGSLEFDATKYLTYYTSDDWNIGLADFTVQWWQNKKPNNQYSRVFSLGTWPDAYMACSVENETLFLWGPNSSESISFSISDLVQTNRWVHVRIARSSGVTRFFINGVMKYKHTDSAKDYDIPNGTPLTIGNENAPTSIAAFIGYLADFQWVKGASLSNSDATFALPTEPVQATDETKLLLNVVSEDNAYGDSSVANHSGAETNVTYSPKRPYFFEGEGLQPAYPQASQMLMVGADSFNEFVGTVDYADYEYVEEDGEVVYDGPDEWSYSRFMLHYAKIAEVTRADVFIYGNRLTGLTQTYTGGSETALFDFHPLLLERVKTITALTFAVSYEASMAEYGSYCRNGNSIAFPLDVVWADDAIDFIALSYDGVHTDWRDNAQYNEDYQLSPDIYNQSYLQRSFSEGNGFSYYYEGDNYAERNKTFPWNEDERWRFPQLYKDIAGYMAADSRRLVDDGTEYDLSELEPRSKPVMFTNVSIPSQRLATNLLGQYVTYPATNTLQIGSANNGSDDRLQMAFISAFRQHWSNPANQSYMADESIALISCSFASYGYIGITGPQYANALSLSKILD